MTWLDWLVVALFIYFIVQGLVKGVGAALLGALAVVLAYVLAAMALEPVGTMLQNSTLMPRDLSPEWRRTVGFVATFGIFYLACMLLISILPGGKRPTTPTQVLGVFGGAVKATLASMALLGILLASPLAAGVGQDVQRSPMLRYLAELQRASVRSLRYVVPFPPVGPDHKF